MGTTTFPGTFETIKDPDCLNPPLAWSHWTVGEQYRDSNNGLVGHQNAFSMLARWQGNTLLNSNVVYDMGRWTGLHSAVQRGYQPESSAGSPGAQIHCYDAGMLINTWEVPHRPIVGGGYNDMYGYSWAQGTRVRPFIKGSQATHLVLQANLGVNVFNATSPVDGHATARPEVGSAQMGFFAYLRDTAHPDLPPIVILATTHDSRFNNADHYDPGHTVNVYRRDGLPGVDYSNTETVAYRTAYPNWFAPGQTGDGVYFVSAPISKSTLNQNRYVSIWYTDGELDSQMAPHDDGGTTPMPFFRAHITPQNMQNAVADIVNFNCPAVKVPCPNRASVYPGGQYSSTAADYELEYAGVIAETTLRGADDGPDTNYDVSPSSWIPNDAAKNQVSIGVHIFGLGVYRAIPN